MNCLRAQPRSVGPALVRTRGVVQLRSPKVKRCQASAAGSPSEDPYSVLGLPQGADTHRIEAAYRKAKRDAEVAQDNAALERIEAAHNSLFMASLSSRLSGSGPVDKKVRNADRTRTMPWLPKRFRASDFLIKVAAGMYGAVLLYNFALMARPDGVVTAMMCGVGLNAYKQYQLFPAESPEMQKRLDQGWRNIGRAVLLTVCATIVGIGLFWTVPDFLAEKLQIVMPIGFYENQMALLTLGSILANFLFTAFMR